MNTLGLTSQWPLHKDWVWVCGKRHQAAGHADCMQKESNTFDSCAETLSYATARAHTAHMAPRQHSLITKRLAAAYPWPPAAAPSRSDPGALACSRFLSATLVDYISRNTSPLQRSHAK